MKKIFISYGDDRFKNTLKRLRREAKELGIFDEIILYTPKDLPDYIKSCPLMAYQKGGGYWIWKPYIILNTLQNCNADDIVIYADAGCSLQHSNEWDNYFELLNYYNAIVFNYRDNFDYGWHEYFNCNSPKIKHWTKQSVIDFFGQSLNDYSWIEKNKIMATCSLFKNKHGKLINEWLNISLLKHELLYDPFDIELINQNPYFVAHRHDQSILTPLAYYFSNVQGEVLILPETSESNHTEAAIIAKRLRNVENMPIKSKIRRQIKSYIGMNLYAKIKKFKNSIFFN